MDADALRIVYAMLREAHGPQRWWPAETRFEVMIGAILTQNTAWSNVERALTRLRDACALEAEPILALSETALAEAVRPSGYFNVKARRLRGFCAAYVAAGGEAALERLPTPELRTWLLGISGIGPETADDILLYAFERPVFVVDAYTRRLFERLGLLSGTPRYEQIRAAFERALAPDVPTFKEYHALIVAQGKAICQVSPRCGQCALAARCAYPR